MGKIFWSKATRSAAASQPAGGDGTCYAGSSHIFPGDHRAGSRDTSDNGAGCAPKPYPEE